MSFLQMVEEAVGSPVLPSERQFLRTRQRVQWAEETNEPEDLSEVVDDAAEDIRALRAAGLSQRWEVLDVAGSRYGDGRWELIASLRERLSPGQERWAPLAVAALETDVRDDPDRLGERRVLVEFDSRLSLSALTTKLREIWPDLLRDGQVRRTRPIQARGIALLRYVSLETSIEDTWAERLDKWAQTYPNWPFQGVRQFNAAFHRAEEQLTGLRRGLAAFYDHDAWARLRPVEVVLALAEGDGAAYARLGDELGAHVLRRAKPVAVELRELHERLQEQEAAVAAGWLEARRFDVDLTRDAWEDVLVQFHTNLYRPHLVWSDGGLRRLDWYDREQEHLRRLDTFGDQWPAKRKWLRFLVKSVKDRVESVDHQMRLSKAGNDGEATRQP